MLGVPAVSCGSTAEGNSAGGIDIMSPELDGGVGGLVDAPSSYAIAIGNSYDCHHWTEGILCVVT